MASTLKRDKSNAGWAFWVARVRFPPDLERSCRKNRDDGVQYRYLWRLLKGQERMDLNNCKTNLGYYFSIKFHSTTITVEASQESAM